MRNALRFPTNLPTYLTARLDATESSWTTRSLVFTIGLPLVSPTRKDRIRMRSQIRRSVRGLYSSHGKRLTLSHAPATAHSAQNQTVRIHGRAARRGTTCPTYQLKSEPLTWPSPLRSRRDSVRFSKVRDHTLPLPIGTQGVP